MYLKKKIIRSIDCEGKQTALAGKKLIFAVGGTGGHLFPAQAVALQLRRSCSDIDILFGGYRLETNLFFDASSFTRREIRSASPFARKGRGCLTLLQGIYDAYRLMKEYRPDMVVGFGSFYSFPTLLIAWLCRVRYVLVETNLVAGRVNRLFEGAAEYTVVPFPLVDKGGKRHFRHASVPSKAIIDAMEKPTESKEDMRLSYGLDPNKKTLLIFGGSQGARSINWAVQQIDLQGWQVIHLCGKEEEVDSLRKMYHNKGILAAVKPFESKMHRAFLAADLLLCRAGAATIMEAIYFSVPAIIIPWPLSAENHQFYNAKWFEEQGGGIMVEEKELDSKLSRAFAQVNERRQQIIKNLYVLKHKMPDKTLSQLLIESLEKRVGQ